MAAITASQVLLVTDKSVAWWIALKGTNASGYGLGGPSSTAGAWKKGSEIEGIIAAFGDWDLSAVLGTSARLLRDNSDSETAGGSIASALLSALNRACSQAGITGADDLNTFATAKNTAVATWQCLFAPDFLDLYLAVNGTAPSPWNVYFEILQGATYANAMGKLVVGTGFTSGATISSSSYAGGFGQVTASGITGSDTVTVGGTWRKPDGTTETGNGTASVTGNGTVVLTPPTANDLLLSVSSISAGAGITAGTIYAEALRPAGRTNPPT